MTNLKGLLFRISAITLCILLVLTMMCNYVHIEYENSHNTQFFAAPFSLSLDNKNPPSSIGKPVYKFVSWVNPFKAIFEEELKNLYYAESNQNLIYNSFPYAECVKRTSSFIYKPTMYVLRI